MSLQHVYFRYNNNDAYALNDINCTFLQNKKYAIMGPSGSGKSTLAKVISGMYRNYEGNILYDGKELRNMSHAESTHVIETIPVPSRFMRKFICRLRLSEVSRQ